MITKIGQWGNSLAIRIPKPFAAEADLKENAEVELALEGDAIVVRPKRREWTLDELGRNHAGQRSPRAKVG